MWSTRYENTNEIARVRREESKGIRNASKKEKKEEMFQVNPVPATSHRQAIINSPGIKPDQPTSENTPRNLKPLPASRITPQ